MASAAVKPITRSITLAPDLAEVARARHLVTEVATDAGFSEERVFDITLACSEATANAVEHAPVKDKVEVKTLLFPDRLEIQIAGPGEFQTPDRLNERAPRGLGLPLMARLADHLALYSGPRGGTLVSLTFYVPGAEPTDEEEALPPSVRELIESNELISAITENAPVGIYVLGPDLRFRWTNQAWRDFLDEPFRSADLSGIRYIDVVPRAAEAGLMDILDAISQKGIPHSTHEYEFHGFGRGVTYWKWDAMPLKHELGAPPYDVLAVISEVTEQVRQRKELESLAHAVERERDRLETILETSPSAVAILEVDGMLSYVNKRAAEILGSDPFPIRGTPVEGTLTQGRSVRSVETQMRRADGVRIPLLVSAAPLRDTASAVTSAVVVFEDISERKQAEEALAEAHSALSAERSFFSLLLDSVPVPISYLDADLVYRHANRAAREALGFVDQEIIGLSLADVVGRDSESFKRLDAVVRTGERYEATVEFRPVGEGPPSYYLVSYLPDTGENGVVRGVFAEGTDISRLVKTDQALFESEQRYRRLAEDRDRLYRQQLAIAENLQLALLNIPSEIGPVTLGHLYRSATEAARVGGDFYDVFEVKGGKIALLIGDVAGHGIEAARTATLVKDVVHAFTHQSLRTHEVLRRTNKLLIEKDLAGFVTLFLGILDGRTGELRYSSAGHPETLLRRASGRIQTLAAGSSPLGVYPEATWGPHEVELAVNDVLVLYTDGVIEARREGEFFGEKRLKALIGREGISPQRLCEVIVDEVLDFSEGRLADDVAVIALSLSGSGPVDPAAAL